MTMSSFKLLLVLLFVSIVCGEDEKVQSLCENPVIHAADHMLNGTIRVFRDYHYWDIIGIPSRKTTTDGPHRIWWSNFAPILKNMTVITILAGVEKGTTYLFSGSRYKSWFENGMQSEGGSRGQRYTKSPHYSGFRTAYHDGNLSGLGYPIMVAFKQIRIWYYNTEYNKWPEQPESLGNKGFIDGNFNEKFPGDIIASFMWPSFDPEVKYFVYLFRDKRHCFRSWRSKTGKDCDEWRENRELFGCTDSGSDQTGTLQPEPEHIPGPKPEPAQQVPNNSNKNFSRKLEIISVLLLILFCIQFYL